MIVLSINKKGGVENWVEALDSNPTALDSNYHKIIYLSIGRSHA